MEGRVEKGGNEGMKTRIFERRKEEICFIFRGMSMDSKGGGGRGRGVKSKERGQSGMMNMK